METRERPIYTIRRARTTPELQGQWDSPAWRDVEPIAINHFHEKSSDHRPTTRAKALHDDTGIYVLYTVQDRYVRCVHTGFQSSVWLDSCVEFFVFPAGAAGYFNFEFNCGGHLLVSWVTDSTRTEAGLKTAIPLTSAQIAEVRIYHSLPERINPELTELTQWSLEAFIPWTLFHPFGGKKPNLGSRIWRGNFYKCGDETSHPHWGAWADITPALNFHQPHMFGELHFID